MQGTNGYTEIFAKMIETGTVSIPTMLITHYQRLGLSETDLAVLLHLIVFREKEQITFPTIDQMHSRMSVSPQLIISSFERLIKQGLMVIEEIVDAETGIHSENYHLHPLYERLAELAIADYQKAADEAAATIAASDGDEPFNIQSNDIFTTFENEFGRPLTPMEIEMVSRWLDQDEYSDPLIRAALKEAVFAGKVHFRYIDRILLEWSRNRVHTPEQAKEYAKQFRGR